MHINTLRHSDHVSWQGNKLCHK